MSENLLEIRNFLIEEKIEGSWRPIVNGLGLKLQKGEIVGLIRESDTGSSTLGLAVLGYTKPGHGYKPRMISSCIPLPAISA